MKKIILVILSVLLFVPSIIFADMGAPSIESYKATITNKDGAVLYQHYERTEEFKATNKKMDYGKTVNIIFEEGGYAQLENNDYVKLSDIALVTKEYTFKDREWQSPVRSLVLKDQDIRKGPADAYESTGVTVKAGTKLNVRTNIGDGGGSPWVYVEYNGTKGYLNSYDEGLTLGESHKPIIFARDTELVDVNTGKVIETIKANTKVTGKIYSLDRYSFGFYIEFENKKGIVNGGFRDETMSMEDKLEEFKVVKKADVYESLNNIGTPENPKYKAIGTVDAGKVFKSSYYIQQYSYVIVYYEEGNVKGWIKATNEKYSDSVESTDTIGVLSFNESIGSEDLFFTTPYTDEELAEGTSNGVEKEPTIKPTDVPVSIFNQTLLLCIIGALLLFIVALVTIMLVNKKKNK